MCCSWYLNFYFYQDPKFDPDLSSTFRPVKCNLDCSCDDDGLLCVYERQYAEMSTSSGILGEDIISFGNQSELVPQRATFGCETVETGDLYSQRADGIMGLGSGELSIVDQLVEKGVINDTFSLCYGGMDIGGGAMVLGGISTPSDMAFSFSDRMRRCVQMSFNLTNCTSCSFSTITIDSSHTFTLVSGWQQSILQC